MVGTAVWSWVRATWFLPVLLLAGCEGKIGGDAPLQSQFTGDAGVMVSPNQPCPIAQTLCDGRCVDTATDGTHCGTCSTACGVGSVCEKGACHELCAQGETACGGACVSMQSDPSHCGACDKVCPAGQYCSDGACSATCAHQLCDSASGAQQCVDTATHPDNCGGCGALCKAGQSCVAGTCKLLCPDGRTACGDQCLVLSTDSSNCGSCGNVCSGAQGCVDGACGCHAGQTLCSGVCTDTTADSTHCGNCTTACAADSLCDQGICKPKTTGCSAGLSACAGSCVDLQASASHCGTCETVCPNAQTCVAGKCTCPNGGTLCGTVCVDAQTSDVNCGACGTTCSGGQHCTAGKCACPSGQTSCNGACVDLMTNSDDCGACNMACAGGQTCTAGKCACATGQTLCGGTCLDTTSSNANCGACGKACATGLSCSAGSCTSNSGADGCSGTALGISIQQIAAYQSVKIPLMTGGMAVPPAPPNMKPTASQRNADVVVGRDTLFRVFVSTASGFTSRQLSGRITLTNGDTSDQYFAKQTVSASSTEADTASTFMIFVPASKIKADTQYRVELVECGTGSGSMMAPQFPATGTAALSARTTGTVKIKVISILANGHAPDTTDASLAIYRDQFMAMYPISAIDISFGDQISVGYPIDWTGVLDTMRAKRQMDAPAADVYYYGLLKPADTFAAFCGNSCTTGIGYVAGANTPQQRAALGIGFGDRPSAETMAHEVGHNHGRNHANCVPPGGTISGVDASYPYANGSIGVWGYDQRKKTTILDPAKDTDIMGYCNTKWISDYSYQALVNRVATVNGAQDQIFNAQAAALWRVLLLDSRGPRWGLPITRPSLPEGAPIIVRILDETGTAITEVEAYRTEISDDVSAMVMVPEPQPGWAFVEVAGYAPHRFDAPVTVQAP